MAAWTRASIAPSKKLRTPLVKRKPFGGMSGSEKLGTLTSRIDDPSGVTSTITITFATQISVGAQRSADQA